MTIAVSQWLSQMDLQVRIVKHAFDIINLLTDSNPIQILVDAIINRWLLFSGYLYTLHEQKLDATAECALMKCSLVVTECAVLAVDLGKMPQGLGQPV